MEKTDISPSLESREGMIIECPLNELFNDFVTVTMTSWMVSSKNLVTVAVSQNVGTSLYNLPLVCRGDAFTKQKIPLFSLYIVSPTPALATAYKFC